MIVVYTAVFGGYDRLLPVEQVDGVRFVAFTDGEGAEGWQCLRPPVTMPTPRLENRKYKACPHTLFSQADWTIYIDGNLQLTVSPHDICKEARSGLNVFRHNTRDCAYEEFHVVIRREAEVSRARRQILKYQQEGFPERYGLFWGGLIVRNKEASEFNQLWWDEIFWGMERDQVSMPYAIWKTGVPLHVFSGDIPFHGGNNRFCVRRSHVRGIV